MIPNWDYYMWQNITLPYSLSLAGCSRIHPWQDDTKLGLLYVAEYHFTLLAFFGRMFQNSSLAGWYQIEVIGMGPISCQGFLGAILPIVDSHHVAGYIFNSLWLAGCSQIYIWQDDTKMSSLHVAGYNSNSQSFFGRMFQNSSLAGWYQNEVIGMGPISCQGFLGAILPIVDSTTCGRIHI